jgi:P-type Cu+ transporter
MNSCLYCQSVAPSGATFCCRACEILHEGQFQLLQKKSQLKRKEKWLAFDQSEVRNLYKIDNSKNHDTFRFYIEGLQCASCVHLLERLPQFDNHIHKAEVFFGSSELIVVVNRDFLVSDLFSLLEEMGYTAHLLKKDESAQESWQKDSRRWLKEIAVAGACTGNIMMFIVPVYSGVTDPYRSAFLWLSFVLFLPIVIYSAQSIYQGAWRALKTRTLNTDLALTLALWGGFTLSTYNLLRHSDEVYFDSTASFLFLILVSRYFVKKVQRHTILKIQKQDAFGNTSYLKKMGVDWIPQIAQLLKTGDEIKLQRNQTLPCDAEILSSQSEWDSSLMTGEVLPRLYNHHMKVHAGYRLLSDEAYLRILQPHDQSEIQQMLQLISRQSLAKSHFILKMDVWSQRLLLVVFAVGLLFFTFYSTINLEAAFQRTLALWIVACPCALAFAAPLTLYKALLQARKKGLLIKNPDVFEKAKSIKELVFDKTGTLTTGQLCLVKTEPTILPQKYKDIILQLESRSQHPVAFAFRKAWPEGAQLQIQLSDIYEKIGEKVYGLLDGKIYVLQGAKNSSEFLKIQLLENSKVIAEFEFKDELYPETATSVFRLKNKYPCTILSGDTENRVAFLAKEISVSPQNSLGGLSPLQKWNYIKSHPNALMIGDGANDAAALQESLIGVASHGSLEVSFRVADIYLLKKGIEPILHFFAISQRYQMILKRNFILAITYNSVAGVCALLGLINPLIAALLMPLSSLLLLFSTMEGWS